MTFNTDFGFLYRPFSNIDEDLDDIECDNPECPEEIQELKHEILSAYQVGTMKLLEIKFIAISLHSATKKHVWNSETTRKTEKKLK